MTRKTYRDLANRIGLVLAQEFNSNVETRELIDAMCSAMKTDNPRFDRQTFLDAIETARVGYKKNLREAGAL